MMIFEMMVAVFIVIIVSIPKINEGSGNLLKG